ncbi:MAG: hypothetical protein IKG56_04395 [Clostridia bacterium]|nr:hypothetical protein [Clostridia bacterium]
MKKNNKKNQKKILLIIGLILLLVVGIKIIVELNLSLNIKRIIESYGSTYYKTKRAGELGYKKDIYLLISMEPIEENGQLNQNYYEKLITSTASKFKGSSYRLLDEKNSLVIRVKYDDEIKYTINNEENYFKKIKQQKVIQNSIDESKYEIDTSVKAELLNNLINTQWNRKNSINKNDTIESSFDNYDYYFDEGYKIRTINSKVYNLVFTKQYRGEIVDGITTNMENSQIMDKLGSPIYMNNSYELIGYITKDFYIFFYDGEISVYEKDVYDEEENKKFAKILTNFSDNGDYKTFINELTDLYNDYSKYENENNQINITYPNRGFKISIGNHNQIQIYSNYKGFIKNDISIDQIKNNRETANGIVLKLDTNLIFEEEMYRVMEDKNKRNPQFDMRPEEINTLYLLGKNYTIIYKDGKYKIYSKNKENFDSEINVDSPTSIYEYNDNAFVYGVRNSGIYYYDAITKEKKKIATSSGECKIEKVEGKTIYYDGNTIDME